MTQHSTTLNHVAFFGGAFNPPHLGHRAIARWLLQTSDQHLPFDAVWVVPSYQHPFGKDMAPFENRLEMCRLQFSDLPNITVMPIERDTGISYTYDLLTHLAHTHRDKTFTLVIGSDTRQSLSAWKSSERLVRDYSIFEIPRASDATDSIDSMQSPIPNHSSTRVRALLETGVVPHAALGDTVSDYIVKHRLYSPMRKPT